MSMTATSDRSEAGSEKEGTAAGMGWRRVLSWTLVVVLLGTWFFLLRPQFLGGSTAYVMVSGESMEPTYHTGDLAIVRRQSEYRAGDVVAFQVPEGEVGAGVMVIHRVVSGSERGGYVTQGDNRKRPDEWRLRNADITGRTWILVPAVGRILTNLRSPLALATIAALIAMLIVIVPDRKKAARGKAGEA